MADRFFFDRDNSGHWYLVEADRAEDWAAWRDLDEDDPVSWDTPDYSSRINGGPSSWTFTDPKDER